MFEVGEILVAACGALVDLQIVERDDSDVDVTERGRHRAAVARLELDAGKRGQ